MILITARDEDTITVLGTVKSTINQNLFKVQLHNSDNIIEAYRGGKMKINDISILEGDEVEIVISKHNLHKGRIVFRKKKV